MGWKVTQPRVFKRIKILGLQAKAIRKHKATTESHHNKHVSDNLLLRFKYQVRQPYF